MTTMQIKVVRYTLSASPLVQAFVDIECDRWLRIMGINFLRNGRLQSAQLTPWRPAGKRVYYNAIEIPDADLRTLIEEEILSAIHAHVATLPPEQRSKPIKPPTPPKPAPIAPAVSNRQQRPFQPQPTKPLSPPDRLSVPKRKIKIHA
jgi:hypothetical protein